MSRDLSRAEELYHRALARPTAEREPFIDEACRGDAELLREVKTLLTFQADARQFLDEPVAEAATRPVGLVNGARLGHFQVVELIDAGGMGEVYRARDEKLGRDVALKVLPAAFSRDAERVARLEREARLLATLSHPNIEAIHGLEELDGRHALVLELIPGETLADRLARGPIPVPEALELARQMAEALEAAHAEGIIHRDIKPSNVKVTPKGEAKLLDFGLAKPLSTEARELDRDSAPDPQADGTRSGLILGTVRYMSPEQAQGMTLDERTDIWSFGAVLFEMLTAKPAFDGRTAVETLGSLLRDEPVWKALPGDCPREIVRLIRHCLRKCPTERLQSIADARIELQDALTEGVHEGGDPQADPWLHPFPHSPASRWRWFSAAALVATVGAAVMAGRWSRPPSSSTSEVRAVRGQIELRPDLPLTCGQAVGRQAVGRQPRPEAMRGRSLVCTQTEFALDPAGTRLVWTSRARATGPTSLYLRQLATGEVARVTGTEDGNSPFFSPDGRWVGFVARVESGWSLRKVSVEGGLPTELAHLEESPVGASWSADGKILLGSQSEGISWIPAEGGPLREVTKADPTREFGHRAPQRLPARDSLLLTSVSRPWAATTRVEVASLSTGERQVLIQDASAARYTSTGHIIFLRRGILMAAAFDLDALELTTEPLPIAENVSQALGEGITGMGQFSISDSGLLAYAPGGLSQRVPIELLLLDALGHAEPLPGFDRTGISPQPAVSPDGRRLAIVERGGAGGRLWLFDLQRRTYRLLSQRGLACCPQWSPDGTRLLVAWSEEGPMHLWMVPSDGGEWQDLAGGEQQYWVPSWSPDQRYVAFLRSGPPSSDLMILDLEDGSVRPFVASPAMEYHPAFSPDGRWIAYTSDESGRWEVYITSFPGRERTLTVSSDGGESPAWSPDGRRLFYLSVPPDGPRSMMAVTLGNAPEASLGPPTRLFSYEMISLFPAPLPDGRFIVGHRREGEDLPATTTRLEAVYNWLAEFERLSPSRQ